MVDKYVNIIYRLPARGQDWSGLFTGQGVYPHVKTKNISANKFRLWWAMWCQYSYKSSSNLLTAGSTCV